jgi:hypothetical protein
MFFSISATNFVPPRLTQYAHLHILYLQQKNWLIYDICTNVFVPLQCSVMYLLQVFSYKRKAENILKCTAPQQLERRKKN